MDIIEMLEGGGLLIVCVLIIVFAMARNKRSPEGWPKGIIVTNFLVLAVIATGFFGLATFIDSFIT